jgi:hypothetical protein
MSRQKTNQSNSKSISKIGSIRKNSSAVIRSQNSQSNVLNSQSNYIDNEEEISEELKTTIEKTVDIFAKKCCSEVYNNTELLIQIKKIVELRTDGLKFY